VIGSPRAYLSRNRRAITWLSNYRYPITTCNWLPVIGHLRDLHVSYARFNGFLLIIPYGVWYLWKALVALSLKRSAQNEFRNLLNIRLISNWTEWSTMPGEIVLPIANRPHAVRSSNFEITRPIIPWILIGRVPSLVKLRKRGFWWVTYIKKQIKLS